MESRTEGSTEERSEVDTPTTVSTVEPMEVSKNATDPPTAEATSAENDPMSLKQEDKTADGASSKPTESTKECPKFLDLAFAMDCTGSMGSYIHSAQQNIRSIVEQIVSEEKADTRLALVQYRDHPPQDSTFVTKVDDFTSSVRSMKGWLDGCQASGGGDQAEAVADALHQVLKLSWREEATKVCIFIADAPPHGIGCGGDGFPKGCPDGLDPMEITNEMAAKHISLYMVGCEPSIVPYRDFFTALAHLTGGQYVPLGSATLLAKVITGGVQEEISLQMLMQEVNQQVVTEFSARGDGEVEEEVLTRRVHAMLKEKGKKTKKLQRNMAELPEASVCAQKMSMCSSLADYREHYGVSTAPPRSSRGRMSAMPMMSAPPPKGGIMNRLKSLAGFSSAPRTAAAAPPRDSGDRHADMADDDMAVYCEAELSMPSSLTDESTPPATESASESDIYECIEDEVSEVQVQRMVQKSVWSNDLKGRYKKKF